MKLLALENAAVRVMYFLNVIDSFLPFSAACYFAARAAQGAAAGFSPAQTAAAAGAFLFVYLCCVIAEFHLFFLAIVPALLFFRMQSGVLMGSIGADALWLFLFTSAAQIAGMGIPNALAARDPTVPLRVYINSFVILAPTTISLPVTLGYQLILVECVKSCARKPLSSTTIALCAILLAAAIVTRIAIRRRPLPEAKHPPPKLPPYRRVMILNIDGLSFGAFSKARAPFVQNCAQEFFFAATGAHTVYKAFTNPAFASILTGTTPDKHGVYNNNFGQAIRVEALPDIVETRLYGSMHVKHFSRKRWNVSLVSLVELGHKRADPALVEKLEKDMLAFPDTRLWVVDLSLVDYCGHAWGGYTRQYHEAITQTDALVATFFGWCAQHGFLDDTLFVISSDHGLFIGEHAYKLFKKEAFVPLIFAGPDIAGGSMPADASITDIAANISYCLGIPYCKASQGRVFEEMRGKNDSGNYLRRLGLAGSNISRLPQ